MRIGAVAYLTALLVLVAGDGVWLTVMLPTYRHGLGELLAATPQLTPAVVFYLLYATGVVTLVVLPGPAAHRWRAMAARGALFGLVAYGTYDLTNQATLRDWPAWLTVLDMAWGTLLSAAAAMFAHAASRAARSSQDTG